MTRRQWIFVAVGALILGAVFYIRSLNTPLSLLNVFNRETGEKAQTTRTESVELIEQDLLGHKMMVPEGYTLSVFAEGLSKARFMTFSSEGVLHLSEMDTGNILSFPGKSLVLSGLQNPHGLLFHEGFLYVAEETQVIRYKDGKKETVVAGLPGGGNHITRTIAIKDDKLYVSVGSSCNVCEEKDKRRAAIVRYNLDGTGEEIFAEGLRNSVGIIFGPDGKLWGTDNGRDLIGDDVPPEEVNIIEQGKYYGWPYCYGNHIWDKSFGKRDQAFCDTTVDPTVSMQAHSAPLGLRWGPDGALYVAFHGSWNRTVPTGYKVVRIEKKEGEGYVVKDYITGWLEGTKSWGRPVDVIFDADGNLYISDDSAGIVYRLSKQ
jgi:glucose/arabinose dehydrogenase